MHGVEIMPKVSVVITCYNLGRYLDEAITSVLDQSYADYEIVVVDDGSTDTGTRAMFDDFQRPSVRLIRTSNEGVAAARNRGISEGTGEFILALDADDRIGPTYLEKAVAVLERQANVGIVYCEAELFGERQGKWDLPEYSLPHMLLDNQIFSAALFRREDWLTVSGYDDTMRVGWEDWDFWLRILALERRVVSLPEVLFFYRIRHGSRERSLGYVAKLLIMGHLLNKHRRLYVQNSWPILKILLGRSRRPPAAIDVSG